MKKYLKLGAITITGMLLLSGCRTVAVYNVDDRPIEMKLSSDKVYDAIKTAGNSKGWVITKVKPGLALGRLNLREHQAVVDIPYTANSFSIKYRDSLNLKYDIQTGQIHKNYNSWIQNLENAINFQLSI